LIAGNQLLKRSYATLLAGAREASPASLYDTRGYASDWRHNVLAGLPLPEIAGDLSFGVGHELDGKLGAAHSSAALAVNTFGIWRTDPSSFRLYGVSGFTAMHFEATCPTGLNGTPPHLDLIVDGQILLRSSRNALNGCCPSRRTSPFRMTGCENHMAVRPGSRSFKSYVLIQIATSTSTRHNS
jgi:hypothetical protein